MPLKKIGEYWDRKIIVGFLAGREFLGSDRVSRGSQEFPWKHIKEGAPLPPIGRQWLVVERNH